jgi:hypothetical protein
VCDSCSSSLKLRAALFAVRVVRVRVHGGRSRWSGGEVADNGQCAPGALTSQLTPRLTAQPTNNRREPVIRVIIATWSSHTARSPGSSAFGERRRADNSSHRAHILPTICPQLQTSPVISSDELFAARKGFQRLPLGRQNSSILTGGSIDSVLDLQIRLPAATKSCSTAGSFIGATPVAV